MGVMRAIAVPKKRRKKKRNSTFPWPGGPKSHSTDVKPMPLTWSESQCRDFELLKCCSALSEWVHRAVSSCDAKT